METSQTVHYLPRGIVTRMGSPDTERLRALWADAKARKIVRYETGVWVIDEGPELDALREAGQEIRTKTKATRPAPSRQRSGPRRKRLTIQTPRPRTTEDAPGPVFDCGHWAHVPGCVWCEYGIGF